MFGRERALTKERALADRLRAKNSKFGNIKQKAKDKLFHTFP